MKITVFGEILWDIFEDEKKIGGAPFNFAAHAKKIGCDTEFISAVGKDELGVSALEQAKLLGINTDCIQTIDKPTGHCLVTLKDGTPSYKLVEGVAYDYIPFPAKKHFNSFNSDALYFGTLAQRNTTSADTLDHLIKGNYQEVFFDINIRQNFYNDDMIDRSLKVSTILKISREEISVLKIPGTPEEICRIVADKYQNLRLIIVTLDCDGALAFDCKKQKFYYSPKPASKAVSTVGAGDSFSACFLCHYLNGTDIDSCLKKATLLADYVVTQLGAVPDYPETLLENIQI